MEILRKLGRQTEEHQRENPARIGMERLGVNKKLMEHLADYLRNAGDPSATVAESEADLPFASPPIYTLILRWGLRELSGSTGLFHAVWESRGVMVQATDLEDTSVVSVYFTGDVRDISFSPRDMVRKRELDRNGWIDLKDSPLVATYSRIQRMRKEEFFEEKEISLEEQIRLATILSSPRPDYRYGIGNVSGPIQQGYLGLAV